MKKHEIFVLFGHNKEEYQIFRHHKKGKYDISPLLQILILPQDTKSYKYSSYVVKRNKHKQVVFRPLPRLLFRTRSKPFMYLPYGIKRWYENMNYYIISEDNYLCIYSFDGRDLLLTKRNENGPSVYTLKEDQKAFAFIQTEYNDRTKAYILHAKNGSLIQTPFLEYLTEKKVISELNLYATLQLEHLGRQAKICKYDKYSLGGRDHLNKEILKEIYATKFVLMHFIQDNVPLEFVRYLTSRPFRTICYDEGIVASVKPDVVLQKGSLGIPVYSHQLGTAMFYQITSNTIDENLHKRYTEHLTKKEKISQKYEIIMQYQCTSKLKNMSKELSKKILSLFSHNPSEKYYDTWEDLHEDEKMFDEFWKNELEPFAKELWREIFEYKRGKILLDVRYSSRLSGMTMRNLGTIIQPDGRELATVNEKEFGRRGHYRRMKFKQEDKWEYVDRDDLWISYYTKTERERFQTTEFKIIKKPFRITSAQVETVNEFETKHGFLKGSFGLNPDILKKWNIIVNDCVKKLLHEKIIYPLSHEKTLYLSEPKNTKEIFFALYDQGLNFNESNDFSLKLKPHFQRKIEISNIRKGTSYNREIEIFYVFRSGTNIYEIFRYHKFGDYHFAIRIMRNDRQYGS